MKKFDMDTYISICLQGDYSKLVTYLSETDDAELLEKYRSIIEGDTYFLQPNDESITPLLRAYEDYLKWALTNPSTTKEYEQKIVETLKPFFPRAGFISKFSPKLAYLALHVHVPRYFRKRGYHANFGTISHIPCISLWRKQTTCTEVVELPEGALQIEVVEMDGIITRCWQDYITLGRVGAGGWVTKKGCTYFKEKYDIESDDFKVSLLKHEGQHFFDRKNHPKMKSTDLEYRAKLVEMIYLRELGTFFHFLTAMADSDDRTRAHAYAERKLVQGLSQKIFGVELETNRDAWEAKRDEIAPAARELLLEHSAMLAKGQWDGKSFVI